MSESSVYQNNAVKKGTAKNNMVNAVQDTSVFTSQFYDVDDNEDTSMFSLEEESFQQYPTRAPLFSELNEDECRELWASLALRHTEGLGARSHGKLVQHFGSAFHAVQAAPDWSGLDIPQAKAQSVYNGVWRERAHKEWKQLTQSDVGIILWTSPQYPVLLRHIYDPPVVLYCKGDTSLLTNATISIVGSRLCSREGQRVAQGIAEELSRVGITVVSGMAKGVDATAHYAGLRGVGKTIGVLGTGLDICYPYENKQLHKDIQREGLLVTEFPLGMRAMPQNFPARNRIVSGLSLGVLIVEAAARSGSLITARLALEQNREVYAVPGPITMQQYSGCHELIRQGAHPVFHVDDILRDLASPLQHQLENAPCLNLMRKRRRKGVEPKVEEIIPVRVDTSQDIEIQEDSNTKLDTAVYVRQAVRDMHVPQVEPATYAEKPVQAEALGHAEKPTPAEVSTHTEKPQDTVDAKHDVMPDLPKSGDDLDALINFLKNNQEVHIDIISQNLDISMAKISSLLLVLEMSGQVLRLPGMRYMLMKEI